MDATPATFPKENDNSEPIEVPSQRSSIVLNESPEVATTLEAAIPPAKATPSATTPHTEMEYNHDESSTEEEGEPGPATETAGMDVQAYTSDNNSLTPNTTPSPSLLPEHLGPADVAAPAADEPQQNTSTHPASQHQDDTQPATAPLSDEDPTAVANAPPSPLVELAPTLSPPAPEHLQEDEPDMVPDGFISRSGRRIKRPSKFNNNISVALCAPYY